MTGDSTVMAPLGRTRSPAKAIRATLAWLFGAPHRIAFSCGAAMLAASSVWWLATALAIWQGHAPRSAMPVLELHGLVMVLGFMPFFFTGFLFTAVPKWLGVDAPTARELGGGLAAQFAGWVVFAIGAQSRDPAFSATMGGIGLAAASFGSTRLWVRFAALVNRSRATDRGHAIMLAAAGAMGVMTLWCAAAGVAASCPPAVRASTQVALWLFVGATFVTAAHRMIPFVGAAALPVLDAWRPRWLLTALLGLFAVEAGSATVDALALSLPTEFRLARAVVELSTGLGLSVLAVRWAMILPLRIRLVAMLYAGFAWLALSVVLKGLTHLPAAPLVGSSPWEAAPLHAFTMGFLGSTLLAMLSRIICAQTGRAVVADHVLWRLFWLLQLAIVLRLGATLAAQLGSRWAWPLIVAAAGGWCLLWLVWTARYVPLLARPRQGGRPA